MGATEPLLRRWPSILLILLVGGIAYANTFQVPFILDDEWAIVNYHYIKDPGYLTTPAIWYEEYTGRVVSLWTFALNYRLGGLDVTGYHVFNLLIHLLSSVLVFILLRQTFQTPYFQAADPLSEDQGRTNQNIIPLFTALLFVAHPLQTQAVTYTVQRMTSLATMFYLLSVVLYVKARLSFEYEVYMPGSGDSKNLVPGTGIPVPWMRRLTPLFFLAGSVLVAILAMKTKEIAVTLPLAIALYEVCFFRGKWKRRVFYLLPLLMTIPVVPVTVFLADQAGAEAAGHSLSDISDQFQTQRILSRKDYLFTQFRVIVTYLRLLFLPVNQNLDYDYPTYTTFFTPPVLFSFLFLGVLFALALYLWFVSRRKPTVLRLVSFGIIWFFLTLALESSIIPIPDVIFEHRLYLPAFGAAAAFATVFCLAAEKFFRNAGEIPVCLVAALMVLGLGVATFQRNHVWGDAVRLWQDVVAKSPGKARPYNNLGVALNRAGRSLEAIEALKQAIVLDPQYPDAYSNLGRAYITIGQSVAALPILQRAIQLSPEFKDAYINLAAAQNQLRRFHETITLVERNLRLLGDRVEAHYHLGVAYAFVGDKDAARRQLEIVSRFGAADLAADLIRLLR